MLLRETHMLDLSRREAIAGASALLAASAGAPLLARTPPPFVRREGMRLISGGRPFRYVGTNMWYAAYLGANAPYGNRDRLRRELDRVAGLGIQSVRILGSSENSPLKNSVTPTFRDKNRNYSLTLLEGLDF